MRIYDILIRIINYMNKSIQERPVKWSDRIDLTSTMKNVGGTFKPTKDGIFYVYAYNLSGEYSIKEGSERMFVITGTGGTQVACMPYKAGMKYTVYASASPNYTWVYAYNLG